MAHTELPMFGAWNHSVLLLGSWLLAPALGLALLLLGVRLGGLGRLLLDDGSSRTRPLLGGSKHSPRAKPFDPAGGAPTEKRHHAGARGRPRGAGPGHGSVPQYPGGDL